LPADGSPNDSHDNDTAKGGRHDGLRLRGTAQHEHNHDLLGAIAL
jgi:hypothetical protein